MTFAHAEEFGHLFYLYFSAWSIFNKFFQKADVVFREKCLIIYVVIFNLLEVPGQLNEH